MSNLARALLVSLLLISPSVAHADANSTPGSSVSAVRVLLEKTHDPTVDSTAFVEPDLSIFSAVGATLIADYGSRLLLSVPKSAADAVILGATDLGYTISVAGDLDTISFQNYSIGPDSGVPTPLPGDWPPPKETVPSPIILNLQGYVTPGWSAALAEAGIPVLSSIPPASVVVFGGAQTVARLRETASFIRSITPVSPSMKLSIVTLPDDALPSHEAVVYAYEPTAQSSILDQLKAMSTVPVVEQDRVDGLVSYLVTLADGDASTLTYLDSIYLIAWVGARQLSSERQGMLTLASTNGGADIPTTLTASSNYTSLLPSNIFPAYGGSRLALVGIIDTGFWNGVINPADPTMLKDFVDGGATWITRLDVDPAFPNGADDVSHGTMVASVVSGYSAFDARDDSNHYRYTLGLAPKVKTQLYKFFKCGGVGTNFLGVLISAMRPTLIANYSANNDGSSSCSYTADSQAMDQATRSPRLFTVAAGNSPDGGSCGGKVRGPATARNVLGVGSTDNRTPAWTNNPGNTNVCSWNGSQANQDARNIPSYSAWRGSSANPVKPDIVAPGVRVTGPVNALLCGPNGVYCNSSIDSQDGITYGFSAGTSFSAPAAAGAALVATIWYTNTFGGFYSSPAMTKAMIINGARDIATTCNPPTTNCFASPGACTPIVHSNVDVVPPRCISDIKHIPDNYQGWGMLSLERLLGPAANYKVLDQTVVLTDAAPSWQSTAAIVNGQKATRVTLVYTDGVSLPGPNYPVQNELKLTVCQLPSGSPCWHGNNFGTSSTGYTLPTPPNAGYTDTINNVHQVIIAAGTFATGTQVRIYVDVTLLRVPSPGTGTPRQDFALFGDNVH